jgi:SPP1 gp7 family putative phage head morphogenesis protein
MLRLKREWYEDIEKEISEYFYSTYFLPLLMLLQGPFFNSNAVLISALREGKINYQDGVFSGKFNISMSKELSKFATFDARSKTWKGRPPADILAAAMSANDRMKKLHDQINTQLNDLEEQMRDAVVSMPFSIGKTADEIDKQIREDWKKIGIEPTMTDHMKKQLIEDYNQNQDLNIKNWEPEQITRLRDMVERSAVTGYRKPELIKMIQAEWEVSQNKARFLARQETSLFMSKLRRERNLDAGVRKYKWSTSHDVRVRHDHNDLNGKVFTYGDPPIVDKTTGRKAEPGEDYNCRCVAIPVIE